MGETKLVYDDKSLNKQLFSAILERIGIDEVKRRELISEVEEQIKDGTKILVEKELSYIPLKVDKTRERRIDDKYIIAIRDLNYLNIFPLVVGVIFCDCDRKNVVVLPSCKFLDEAWQYLQFPAALVYYVRRSLSKLGYSLREEISHLEFNLLRSVFSGDVYLRGEGVFAVIKGDKINVYNVKSADVKEETDGRIFKWRKSDFPLDTPTPFWYILQDEGENLALYTVGKICIRPFPGTFTAHVTEVRKYKSGDYDFTPFPNLIIVPYFEEDVLRMRRFLKVSELDKPVLLKGEVFCTSDCCVNW